MFKYTRAGINIIIDDIKKLAKIFKYGTLAFSALYYFVAILLKLGNLVVNIILAILFTAYTIFDFVTDKKENKKTRKIVSRSYSWISIALRTFTLVSTLYGMYLGTSSTTPISIILATLMIILWVLEVLFELIAQYVTDKATLIMTGFQKDTEFITKVGNFFKSSENKKELIKDDDENLIILEKQLKKQAEEKKRKEEEEKLKKEEEKNKNKAA